MRSIYIGAILFASFMPQAGIAGSVTLINCYNGQIFAKLYNSNDQVLMFGSSEKCIQPGKKATLTCATNQCKIKYNIEYCDTLGPGSMMEFDDSGTAKDKVYSGTNLMSRWRDGKPQLNVIIYPGSACPP